MSNVRITVFRSSDMNIGFRTEAETRSIFGEDFLKENGVLIDATTFQHFENITKQYKQMQNVLWSIYKSKLKLEDKGEG